MNSKSSMGWTTPAPTLAVAEILCVVGLSSVIISLAVDLDAVHVSKKISTAGIQLAECSQNFPKSPWAGLHLLKYDHRVPYIRILDLASVTIARRMHLLGVWKLFDNWGSKYYYFLFPVPPLYRAKWRVHPKLYDITNTLGMSWAVFDTWIVPYETTNSKVDAK